MEQEDVFAKKQEGPFVMEGNVLPPLGSTGGGFSYQDDYSGGTSASLEDGGDEDDDDTRNNTRHKKNLKRRMDQLALPAEGMDAALSKETELQIDNLETFDDYVARLKRTRVLTSEEAQAIQKQRKRIHNRLYALQKRAKKKLEKNHEQDMLQRAQAQNQALQEEVQRLREENATLRNALALATSGNNSSNVAGGRRVGGMALFAVLFTFAITLGPEFLSAPSVGAGEGEYGTGRALFGRTLSEVSANPIWLLVRLCIGLVLVASLSYGLTRRRWLLPYFFTPAEKKNV